MLPSKSRAGPNEESPIRKARPSTPTSGRRPSTPSSNHRPSTAAGGSRRSIGAAPRSRSNGGPFKSEPNSPPSAAQNSRPRLSFDRSPRSADLNPVVQRRAPKIGALPDPRREAELQARLESAQEDLNKAKDQLAFIVGERDRLVGRLNHAKRVADETHDKLQDALMAKRWAEEATEIEKFRADELEQVGIDEARKREEEWRTEIEGVRGQHAADLEALVAAAEELEGLRREFAMANDAKKAALGHAEDAMKIAEANAEKVEILSAEAVRLRGSIDSSAASQEIKSREAELLVKNLESDISALKRRLEEARFAEEKLADMEKLIEGLKSELDHAKKAESDVSQLFQQWKHKAGSLEMELEQVTASEKLRRESLASATEELDKTQSVLQDRESEIEALRGKTMALEIEVARLLADIDASNEHLDASQQEVFGLQTAVHVLRNKLEAAEQAASEASSNAKADNLKIQGLVEERTKLISELSDTRDREEREKMAVADLTAALGEASGEAKEAHERFLNMEDDYEHAVVQIGDLRTALKSTKEGYDAMLDEANRDITGLKKTVEGLEAEVNECREQCEAKELHIVASSKQSEEEIAAIKAEASKVVSSLRGAEHELRAVNGEKEMLQEKLMHTESAAVEANDAAQEAIAEKERLQEKLVRAESAAVEANDAAQEAIAEKETLQEKLVCAESAVLEANDAAREAKAESLQLKERLLDKENALQSVTQENDGFRLREAAAMEKIDELSALLAEAMAEKLVVVDESRNNPVREQATDTVAENGDTGGESDKKHKLELDSVNGDGNPIGDMNHEEEKDDARVEQDGVNRTEFAVQEESSKAAGKQPQTDGNQETKHSNHELGSKEEDGSTEHAKGTVISEDASRAGMSPAKPQQQQKKNRPLLKRLGSLLKKRNSK